MVVAFPLGKILYLVVRQVSKPISARLQIVAKQTPFVRTYIIMPPAQGKSSSPRTGGAYRRPHVCFGVRVCTRHNMS